MLHRSNERQQTKEPIDAFALNALHFLLVGGTFYFPLNVLDGDNDHYDGIGYLIVWMVMYYRSFRNPDYYAMRLALTFRETAKSYLWIYIFVIIAMVILCVAWLGWELLWIGAAVATTSLTGVLLFDVLERNYIRRAVERLKRSAH